MARKPSEIFLDLWHQVSLDQMEREDFIECADAWEEIREMEDTQESAEEFIERMRKHADDVLRSRMGEAPEEDKRDELEEKINNAPVHHAGESVAREIQIDQHTFEIVEEDTSSAAEAAPSPQGEGKEGAKPVTWTDKQNALKQRKQEIKERLEEARRNKISGPTLAEAAGVEDTKIYAILNAGQVTIQTYEKVARGLEKLGY